MVTRAAIAASVVALLGRDAVADPELRVGVSELVFQSSFFGSLGTSIDVTGALPLRGAWRGEGGLRLDVVTGEPEGFARIAIAPRAATWRPIAGLELGLTARTDFGDEAGQGADARMAAADGVSPAYVAISTQPLRFAIGHGLVLSALDLSLGTHVSAPGRWTRLQLGFLALGVEL